RLNSRPQHLLRMGSAHSKGLKNFIGRLRSYFTRCTHAVPQFDQPSPSSLALTNRGGLEVWSNTKVMPQPGLKLELQQVRFGGPPPIAASRAHRERPSSSQNVGAVIPGVSRRTLSRTNGTIQRGACPLAFEIMLWRMSGATLRPIHKIATAIIRRWTVIR